MPDAQELLHSNLHEVFSERNPQRRRAAIERTYTEDVTFIDPEGEFVGRQALNDQAQKLLDSVMRRRFTAARRSTPSVRRLSSMPCRS